MGARELSDFTSWNTISRGLNNFRSYSKRLFEQGATIGGIHSANAEARNQLIYNHFLAGVGGLQGRIGGPAGKQVDSVIQQFLKKLEAGGGHKMEKGQLSAEIADFRKEIGRIASSLHGVQGEVLRDFTRDLKEAKEKTSKGGIAALGTGAKDAVKAAFGIKADNSVEEARREIASEVSKAAKTLADPTLKQSITQVVAEMHRLANAAKNTSEKQNILANAQQKLARIARGASGSDRTVLEGLASSTGRTTDELQESLKGQTWNRRGLELNNKISQLIHAIGGVTRYVVPIKRSLDVGNVVFQAVNSKFNQFARMQMRVSAERGGFGRQVRGAGINYGHMMSAIGAGRSAGMDDRQVVGQMVNLQSQLAEARWGEGGLIEKAGRWGISVYNGAGEVKQAHELMIEFSRKLRSLGSNMEKLQFLNHIGRRPEEMEYVANYEKNARRMEWLKQNPSMQGVLEKADILDESGFNAKVDAATKIELRRREILNQNAIEQGPLEALKRSLNPENWLFNDWSARQKGIAQAKGELAMERLTRVLENIAAQGKKGNTDFISAARSMSAEDLAAISAIAQKDIDNKGDKSGFAGMLDAYKSATGLDFDVRTPIEKLQAALVPLTNKLVEWAESIYTWLTKSGGGKAINYAAENPIKTIFGLMAVMAMIRHPIKTYRFLKGAVTKIGGGITKPIEKGIEGAAGKTIAKGASGSAASGGAGAVVSEAAAKGSGRVWWKPSTWFKGGGAATAAEVTGATAAGGTAAGGAARAGTSGATGVLPRTDPLAPFTDATGRVNLDAALRAEGVNVAGSTSAVGSSATAGGAASTRVGVPGSGVPSVGGSAASGGAGAVVSEAAAKGSGRVWWKPSTWFKGGGAATAAEVTGATAAGGTAAGGAISKGATKATETAVEKGVTKSFGKSALKAAGPLTTLAFMAYDSKVAYDAYSRGDTAEGNRTVGSSVGALAGAWGGAKIGAAIGTAIAPGIGTAIGGFLGTVVGGIGGAVVGSWGADKVNEAAEVNGSNVQRKKAAGFRATDMVLDPRRATGDFINALRSALKENDLTKAIKMLDSKGLNVDVEALRDERFMTDDTFAHQTLQGAKIADTLAVYAARSRKAIDAQTFSDAAGSDKYYQAARAQGIAVSENDVVNAALRQTGFSNKADATSLEMAKAYVKNGWNNPEAMRKEMAELERKHPEMSYSERKKTAIENLKEKHQKNLTQRDYLNMMEAQENRQYDILELGELRDEAARYNIDQYGIRRAYNKNRDMIDAEGYLVDSNGNRVDREGRHEGDEGFEAVKVGEALDEDGMAAYENLRTFNQENPWAAKFSNVKKRRTEAQQYLNLSREEKQKKTLDYMEKMGVDVSSRRWTQKFKNEQVEEFSQFIKNRPQMDADELVAEFAYSKGITIDEAREFMRQNGDVISAAYGNGKDDKQFYGLWEEAHKSKAYKAEQKNKEIEKKKEDKDKEYTEAIKGASIEELTEALGGESGQAKKLKHSIYTSWDNLGEDQKKYLEGLKMRAGHTLARKKAKAGKDDYQPLNKPYKPTKEEQADIDAADKESSRLMKEKEIRERQIAKGGRQPLAVYSDLRYMDSVISRGGIADNDKVLEKHFGRDRVKQYREAQRNGIIDALRKGAHYNDEKGRKRRSAPAMSREEAEANFRSMAEANFKKKPGETDEEYKKRIDERVAKNMELFDTLHPNAKKKPTGENKKPSAAASAGTPGTTSVAKEMSEASEKTAQVSEAMAKNSEAAEKAAATGNAATSASAGNVEKNITVNFGGQNITQNFNGENPKDASEMERGTAKGAVEIRNETAEAFTSATLSPNTW